MDRQTDVSGLTSVPSSPSLLSLFISSLLASLCMWLALLSTLPASAWRWGTSRKGYGSPCAQPSCPVPSPGCPCSPQAPVKPHFSLGTAMAPQLLLWDHWSILTPGPCCPTLLLPESVQRGHFGDPCALSPAPADALFLLLQLRSDVGGSPAVSVPSHPNPLILCILFLILLFLLLSPSLWCAL